MIFPPPWGSSAGRQLAQLKHRGDVQLHQLVPRDSSISSASPLTCIPALLTRISSPPSLLTASKNPRSRSFRPSGPRSPPRRPDPQPHISCCHSGAVRVQIHRQTRRAGLCQPLRDAPPQALAGACHYRLFSGQIKQIHIFLPILKLRQTFKNLKNLPVPAVLYRAG